MGEKYGTKDMVRCDKSDLRDTEKERVTKSGSKFITNNKSIILDNKAISNPFFEPDEEEPIGLNVEGLKRSRTGHESQSSMDTDGVLQLTDFAANENTREEVSFSNKDYDTANKTILAKLAEQASLSK